MIGGKTILAYEVVVFNRPILDRDLMVRVNEEVSRVKVWAGHMGPVRVVSLSVTELPMIQGKCTLTIEYTAHDTSTDP